jgi:hypothetical protein
MPNPTELIDDMIVKTPDWRGATLAKLRKIIHDADPEITEEVKWKRPSNPMGAPVYEHNGIVCIGGILRERVSLTLVAGSSLPDTQKLYNAMLKGKSRAIDIYEGDKINETAAKGSHQVWRGTQPGQGEAHQGWKEVGG